LRGDEDVRYYVAECNICQWNKRGSWLPTGLLQPLPVPSVWKVISLDFIDGLPNSARKNSIMVAVDRLTKYV
jgi:hypothetical protein